MEIPNLTWQLWSLNFIHDPFLCDVNLINLRHINLKHIKFNLEFFISNLSKIAAYKNYAIGCL